MSSGDPVDRELDQALARRPRASAPADLRRRLEAMVAAEKAPGRRRVAPWMAPLASACAAGLLVWLVVRPPGGAPAPSFDMVQEAVNDHLRVVRSAHPVEIESGGIHQVKPWFTGRLDFAPRVEFSGDADFPLVGGSVGYFHDRQAAVFLFRHRLHSITLLVFPADRLPWPTRGLRPLGPIAVDEQRARGFNALLWREGELGYALISDVNLADLEQLAPRVNHP
jgi:anti-sigma factor RsiW